jgi:hypothetical protein
MSLLKDLIEDRVVIRSLHADPDPGGFTAQHGFVHGEKPSFVAHRLAPLRQALRKTTQRLDRLPALMRRAETMQRRADHHERQDARRARTRHLIELGGLVQKAGLVELTGDDRNAIFGGLITIAAMLHNDRRTEVMAVLAHRGRRAFRGDNDSPSGDAPSPW